ncbi:tRNA pseudouridine(55) synthase TruB [Methyloversatilis thermotolerans]|uniref:tRNA pseudouridine(55) synthase TruB n=1 Tax=Methyloversatilis thermotolerans TaxID=1346290 RepID=UPI000374B99A|nr:tRNA pseudouridine(55) synthase TruB [Methyloversatilis thermotolerans]
MQTRSRWKAIHGVLLLDKPVGLSSNDALQKARRLFQAARAGHTGTLDPLASGLLPICFGDATRFAGLMLDADKEYIADVRLGVRTATGDAEGEVLSVRPVLCDVAALDAAIKAHTGEICQLPPMHSALKRDGKPLYEYARAGITVEREPRHVIVRRIDRLSTDLPDFSMRVLCSKGTYIRTLAEDIGESLGCGAHLTGLRRTGTGGLTLQDALTLETLAGMDEAARLARLQPADLLVRDMPHCALPDSAALRLGNGQTVALDALLAGPGELREGMTLRAYGPAGFLGLASVQSGCLRAKRLMPTNAIHKPEST